MHTYKSKHELSKQGQLTALGLVDQPYLRTGILLGHYGVELLLEEGAKTPPIAGGIGSRSRTVGQGVVGGHLQQLLIGGESARNWGVGGEAGGRCLGVGMIVVVAAGHC